MSDNLVLERLREMRSLLGDIHAEIRETKQRMTMVERQVGQVVATEQAHYATFMSRLDRMEDRLERIERRLELVE
jgi:tetrahydromethanopterin S-methyltransferase subunit G